MKTIPILITCALLALCTFASAQKLKGKSAKGGLGAAPAATPVPVKETGYQLFHMVRLKNIFDPDRRPMPAEGVAKAAVVTTASGPRMSYLVLTGTMVTETKRLAFFSGSQSAFNRVIAAHEKVGDVEVESISTSHVDLKRGEQNIVLPVGKQLTLGDTATVVAATAPVDSPPPDAAAATPSSTPSAPPTAEVGAPLDQAAIMRRMMERRQKETK